MERLIRATRSTEISQREIKNAALARRVCGEGMVLLENDGALPLRGGKVALYGAGVRHGSFGGSGSGENNPRYRVNPDEGFINGGWEVVSSSWLDDFDALFKAEREEYIRSVFKATRIKGVFGRMEYVAAHPFIPSGGRLVTTEEARNAGVDTAVYILTRHAGEGGDRNTVPGDYYITEGEKALLRSLKESFGKVVLVLNIGAPMDLAFADELGINAILYMMQGGMEAGNGLFDVLTGAVNPSGKLSDTWAKRYEDYPCADTFSTRGGREFEEDYLEDIYVGYRWFDAMGIVPRYAFGHGLSYTSFSVIPGASKVVGSTIEVRAVVQNIGAAAGKEVVQLYISAPEGKLRREDKSLVAYEKTALLSPGESQQLCFSFDISECAAYDEERSAYILQKGEYIAYVGSSSDALSPAAIFTLDEEAVTELCTAVCPMKDALEFISPPAKERKLPNVGNLLVCTKDITCKTHDYAAPELVSTPQVDEIMAKLKDKDLARLLVGTLYMGPTHNTAFGAAGSSTSALLDKGIDNMVMADGPQGLNLQLCAPAPKQNFWTPQGMPESVTMGRKNLLSRIMNPPPRKNGDNYYHFCTAFPCQTLVAQSWNLPLAKELGAAIAEEMVEYGVAFWLAPAMNIHRNVLCGRNFEYYSEDAYLSGKTAAAVTLGIQSKEGCYATIKHFACNNLENSRNRSSSNLS
ncbi:MAG: glycoside hydrolase family 3 C-terminal domain-containing protein, partial [Oscillospiraceae bacterium]|nr:glycoside hydrolase family 3 C-terminal domain-containing protein [Oscillospiraceae bacterium]